MLADVANYKSGEADRRDNKVDINILNKKIILI